MQVEVSKIVLHAKEPTVPLQSSVLKDSSRPQKKCNPDFFTEWIEGQVKQATPSQRKEWKKTGKAYLKTFATTSRMLPLSVLTLAAAPTMPGVMPGQSIINILTLPLVWLMEAVMPKSFVPPITAPDAKTSTLAPPIVHAPQAAISVPQSPSIPHSPMMQQTPIPPMPMHGTGSLIPTPVIPTAGSGPDLTDIAQTALMFVITNGFYILLAVLASTGIMMAFNFHTLAKKVALNTVKGMGILLLSTPAVVLMLYVIMWIMGGFPGFHPPVPVNR